MELFTYAGNFRAFKALIAAEYAGIEITVPAFSLGKDNNTKEFKEMSPLGKLPVLKTPQGALFEVIIWTSVLFLISLPVCFMDISAQLLVRIIFQYK